MKTTKTFLALTAAVAVMSAAASAMAADVTGTANASVVQAIEITENTQMSFGTIASTGTAGTVVLAPAGGTTATNVTELAGGTAAAAQFTVSGGDSAAYTLTLPTSTTLSNGSETMAVSSFTENATETLNGSGSETFNVGATLAVGAAQAAGTYSGTYTVTVNYQ